MSPGDDIELSFPERETYTDCAGKRVEFRLQIDETPVGWSASATEIARATIGYRFEAFSPIHPHLALGDLRAKIREGLATKYLEAERELRLRNRVARGYLAWDRGEHGIVLAIDGRRVTLSELGELLGSYEGWEFELRLKDSSE